MPGGLGKPYRNRGWPLRTLCRCTRWLSRHLLAFATALRASHAFASIDGRCWICQRVLTLAAGDVDLSDSAPNYWARRLSTSHT